MQRRMIVRSRTLAVTLVGGLLLAGCAYDRPAETSNNSTPGPPLPSVSIPPPTYTTSSSSSSSSFSSSSSTINAPVSSAPVSPSSHPFTASPGAFPNPSGSPTG